MVLASAIGSGLAWAEDVPSYELEEKVVIGDSVAEPELESKQAYYRTGGDVTIIDRQEIEDRHYANIKEAVKRIPGVQVSGPGYHAHEYGYNSFSEQISINGDSSVIILVDGKRIDNSVSSYVGNKSKTSLEMITNIANVEKIEVIKGASASIYGADATGGVINIITRKGTQQPETTLDLATGSWARHNYALTHSGASQDGSLKYFFSFNREQSGDTKYKDAELGRVVRFLNTRYKDNGASARIDKEFDDNHALSFSYSHTDSKAHYPITAPEYSTLYRLFNDELYQDYVNGLGSSSVGYRNWFLYDALLGSYTRSQTNNYSVKYTFQNDSGMESFVRLYENRNRYHVNDYSGLFGRPQADMTPENIAAAKSDKYSALTAENARGLDIQLAKKIDKHHFITGWSYQESEYEKIDKKRSTYTSRERQSLYGWLQDKIEMTDQWTLTPSIRYNHYNSIDRRGSNGADNSHPGESQVTFGLNTNYRFGPSINAYFSWNQVYRPLTNYDSDNQTSFEKLQAEKGKNWAVGLNKQFSAKTSADINYSLLDMSNAIARYSVWDEAQEDWATRSINATQKKKALNLGIKHQFDACWGISASYAYVWEDFHAKNWRNNPDDTNVDAMINAFRPTQKYQVDIMYRKDKWSGTLFGEIYSGLNTRYYTNDRFFVLGLGANYQLNPNAKLYLVIDNITNTSYETKISSTYKYGAFPQPSRSFMAGVQYKL